MDYIEAIEEKNEPPKRSMNIIKKNLNTNNTGKIIKAKKMNEFENILSEKNIEKSIESLYILKDKLIFEGEYLNGKRNVKGKEYNKNYELIFDGEYLNGERWNGKGKEYYDNNLIFEGEYLNGKKIGKVNEYKYGKLIFEGEYLNGKKINKV